MIITPPQTDAQQQAAAIRFVALVDALATKHYGIGASDFNIDVEKALECLTCGISALDVINEDAERFGLDRIDVLVWGVPQKAEVTEDDVKAAEAELAKGEQQ